MPIGSQSFLSQYTISTTYLLTHEIKIYFLQEENDSINNLAIVKNKIIPEHLIH